MLGFTLPTTFMDHLRLILLHIKSGKGKNILWHFVRMLHDQFVIQHLSHTRIQTCQNRYPPKKRREIKKSQYTTAHRWYFTREIAILHHNNYMFCLLFHKNEWFFFRFCIVLLTQSQFNGSKSSDQISIYGSDKWFVCYHKWRFTKINDFITMLLASICSVFYVDQK